MRGVNAATATEGETMSMSDDEIDWCDWARSVTRIHLPPDLFAEFEEIVKLFWGVHIVEPDIMVDGALKD